MMKYLAISAIKEEDLLCFAEALGPEGRYGVGYRSIAADIGDAGLERDGMIRINVQRLEGPEGRRPVVLRYRYRARHVRTCTAQHEPVRKERVRIDRFIELDNDGHVYVHALRAIGREEGRHRRRRAVCRKVQRELIRQGISCGVGYRDTDDEPVCPLFRQIRGRREGDGTLVRGERDRTRHGQAGAVIDQADGFCVDRGPEQSFIKGRRHGRRHRHIRGVLCNRCADHDRRYDVCDLDRDAALFFVSCLIRGRAGQDHIRMGSSVGVHREVECPDGLLDNRINGKALASRGRTRGAAGDARHADIVRGRDCCRACLARLVSCCLARAHDAHCRRNSVAHRYGDG